jgi:probable rRNA maturation factor
MASDRVSVVVTEPPGDPDFDLPSLVELAGSVAGELLEEMGDPRIHSAEVGLNFVDELEMGRLNSSYRNKEGPTDVLSFAVDGFAGSPVTEGHSEVALIGDLVICASVAHKNAPHSLQDELSLLVVHGLLHIAGMDHEDPEEASEMEAREVELLARHRTK